MPLPFPTCAGRQKSCTTGCHWSRQRRRPTSTGGRRCLTPQARPQLRKTTVHTGHRAANRTLPKAPIPDGPALVIARQAPCGRSVVVRLPRVPRPHADVGRVPSASATPPALRVPHRCRGVVRWNAGPALASQAKRPRHPSRPKNPRRQMEQRECPAQRSAPPPVPPVPPVPQVPQVPPVQRSTAVQQQRKFAAARWAPARVAAQALPPAKLTRWRARRLSSPDSPSTPTGSAESNTRARSCLAGPLVPAPTTPRTRPCPSAPESIAGVIRLPSVEVWLGRKPSGSSGTPRRGPRRAAWNQTRWRAS